MKSHNSTKEVKMIIRDYGVSKATFYKWRQRYQGMDAKALKRLKELELENQKLKHMYAELALDYQVAKEIIIENLPSGRQESFKTLYKERNCKRAIRKPFRLKHSQGVQGYKFE